MAAANDPRPEFPEPELPNVESVLKHVRNGSATAATELHERYVDRLVRLASTRINQRFRSKIEPEEVVQSVFASFFRRHDEGEFRFANWNDLWALLVRITVRKCVNKVSGFLTAKRDVQREWQAGVESGHGEREVLITIEPSAEEVAVFHETLDMLFDLLSPAQQEIVCLRLEGLSNLEISEKIGRSERTVYRQLDTVRKIFGDMLDE